MCVISLSSFLSVSLLLILSYFMPGVRSLVFFGRVTGDDFLDFIFWCFLFFSL